MVNCDISVPVSFSARQSITSVTRHKILIISAFYMLLIDRLYSGELILPGCSYNVTDPKEVADGEGVPHTIELAAIWGLANGGPASYNTSLNAPIIPVIQGYWTSFIRTLDPNALRAEGTPEWLPWGADSSAGQRLLFMTNATQVENVPVDQQARCDFCLD